MMPATLFLPPYLQSIGYSSAPEMQELSRRAQTFDGQAIWVDPIWGWWRGALDYIACVEYARHSIKAMPTSGSALSSAEVVPAQYHSASLVFFAQATLDNVAAWLSDLLKLGVEGSDCAFHKSELVKALSKVTPALAVTVQNHSAFFTSLDGYRQAWIHRLSGGAHIYADKPPSDPTARMQIMVPINPAIKPFPGTKVRAHLRSISRTRTKNGGRWLLPVTDFADEMAEGLRRFLLAFLAASFREPKLAAGASLDPVAVT